MHTWPGTDLQHNCCVQHVPKYRQAETLQDNMTAGMASKHAHATQSSECRPKDLDTATQLHQDASAH